MLSTSPDIDVSVVSPGFSSILAFDASIFTDFVLKRLRFSSRSVDLLRDSRRIPRMSEALPRPVSLMRDFWLRTADLLLLGLELSEGIVVGSFGRGCDVSYILGNYETGSFGVYRVSCGDRGWWIHCEQERWNEFRLTCGSYRYGLLAGRNVQAAEVEAPARDVQRARKATELVKLSLVRTFTYDSHASCSKARLRARGRHALLPASQFIPGTQF